MNMPLKEQHMDSDWNKLAAKIRQGRFSEIKDYEWLLIADKIDDTPKKRGPKPKPAIGEAGFLNFNFKRGDEKSYHVTRLYSDYVDRGMTSAEAKRKIMSVMGMSDKSVEAYVTAYKKGIVESERLQNELELEISDMENALHPK